MASPSNVEILERPGTNINVQPSAGTPAYVPGIADIAVAGAAMAWLIRTILPGFISSYQKAQAQQLDAKLGHNTKVLDAMLRTAEQTQDANIKLIQQMLSQTIETNRNLQIKLDEQTKLLATLNTSLIELTNRLDKANLIS